MAEPTPFKIAVSDDLLSFINQRVSTARIPPGIDLPASQAWSHGVPESVMSQLQQYWAHKYDWRAVEARINSHLKMFTLPINHEGEDLKIHFVHHRSSREGAIPLLFQHGWPGNFLEVERIIDELVEPKEEGKQAYHVVAPSLPGFVFSQMSKRAEFGLGDIAHVDHKLMTALGYETYMAQGGDWGSGVVRAIGKTYPEHCVAVHVNMVVSGPPPWTSPLTLIRFIFWAMWQDKSKDGGLLGKMMWWQKEETGYLEIQGTKPQTLAYALVDSPLGMLAWIRDKVEYLVDDDFTWTEEEIITWAMLYLIPGTAGHSTIYKNTKEPLLKAQKPYLTEPLSKSVDFGVSIFPKDVLNIPRFWASSTISPNIIFWRDHTKGGHFPSIEVPDQFIADIRDFTVIVDLDKRAALVRAGNLLKL